MSSHPVAPTTLRGLLATVRKSLVSNLGSTIVTAAVGAAIGYVANVLLIAGRYGGSNAPPGSPVTSNDNTLTGGITWTLGMMLAFSIIGYRRAVGAEVFWRDVRGLPKTIGKLFDEDGQAARSHFLWGLAAGMVASQFIAPWLGALMATGVLLAVPTFIGLILAGLVQRVWGFAAQRISPGRAQALDRPLTAIVGLLGGAAALALGFFIQSSMLKLVLALAAAGAAVSLGRDKGGPGTGTAALLILMAPLGILLGAAPAFADDGDFAECMVSLAGVLSGEQTEQWLDCEGTTGIFVDAIKGAIAAGVGASGGKAIGDLVGRIRKALEEAGRRPGPIPPEPMPEGWVPPPPIPPEPMPEGYVPPPPIPPEPMPEGWVPQARGFSPLGPQPLGYPMGPTEIPDLGPVSGDPPASSTATSGGTQQAANPPMVTDERVISGDDAIKKIWEAANPGKPYDPTTPVPWPTDLPPGVKGIAGNPKTLPNGQVVIDPDQPVAVVEEWTHPATPPVTNQMDPPPMGFDPNKLAGDLTNLGADPKLHTGSDGNTYVEVPENLPPNWGGGSFGTKQVDGKTVFDPNRPIVTQTWPAPPAPPAGPDLWSDTKEAIGDAATKISEGIDEARTAISGKVDELIGQLPPPPKPEDLDTAEKKSKDLKKQYDDARRIEDKLRADAKKAAGAGGISPELQQQLDQAKQDRLAAEQAHIAGLQDQKRIRDALQPPAGPAPAAAGKTPAQPQPAEDPLAKVMDAAKGIDQIGKALSDAGSKVMEGAKGLQEAATEKVTKSQAFKDFATDKGLELGENLLKKADAAMKPEAASPPDPVQAAAAQQIDAQQKEVARLQLSYDNAVKAADSAAAKVTELQKANKPVTNDVSDLAKQAQADRDGDLERLKAANKKLEALKSGPKPK